MASTVYVDRVDERFVRVVTAPEDAWSLGSYSTFVPRVEYVPFGAVSGDLPRPGQWARATVAGRRWRFDVDGELTDWARHSVLKLIHGIREVGTAAKIEEEPSSLDTDQPLVVTALRVGQGDSVLVQFPGGQKEWLFDAKRGCVSRLENHPRRHRKRVVDRLLITHGHADHISGIAGLIRSGLVSEIVLLESLAETASPYAMKLVADPSVLRMGLAPRSPAELDTVINGCEVRTAWETGIPVAGVSDQANAASLLTTIRYGDSLVVLSGDITTQAGGVARAVAAGASPASHLLYKASHHCSDGVDHGVFLSLGNERSSLISCGNRNRYKHPHKSGIRELCLSGAVCRTDVPGSTDVMGIIPRSGPIVLMSSAQRPCTAAVIQSPGRCTSATTLNETGPRCTNTKLCEPGCWIDTFGGC